MRYAYAIYNVMFRRIIEILFFLFFAATAAAMMGNNNLDWLWFGTRSAFEFFAASVTYWVVWTSQSLKNTE